METLIYPTNRYNFLRFEQGTPGQTYNIVLYDNVLDTLEIYVLMPLQGGADWFVTDTQIIIVRPIVAKSKIQIKKKMKR